jgi:hypothetical protein
VCTVSRERDDDTMATRRQPPCQPRNRHEPSKGFWCSDGKWRLQRQSFSTAVAWSFKDSLFGAYHNDTEARLRAAFRADYAHTRLEAKLGKWADDLDAAKAVLESNYYLLKNIFRHYAAAYSQEIYNLSSGGFNEFLQRCGILDAEGKGCDRVEVETQFITVNMSGPKVRRSVFLSPSTPTINLLRVVWLFGWGTTVYHADHPWGVCVCA